MGYLSCKTDASVITCKVRKDDIEPAKLKTFRYKDLEAATGGFAVEYLLGKGSYGWVYKGYLRDGKLVAVKKPSNGRRHLQDDNPLDNELEILSKIRSSRLVNLVGFCRDNKETLLVVDFMANGTLHDVLHSTTEPLSWGTRLQLAIQIAKGLRALHTASPPVIHRDIKSSNVLIDADWNAKLGDFGLALRGRIEDVIRLSTPPAGTMGYLDPGYVSPGHLSTKTDVFSFGILLLEIMSGRNAIDVQYCPPNIVDWALPLIKQGKGMIICDPKSKRPANVDAVNEMATIAARCVRLSSTKRPSMAEVVKGLREVSKKMHIPRMFKPLKTSPTLDELKTAAAASILSARERHNLHPPSSSSVTVATAAAAIQSTPLRRARVRVIYAENSYYTHNKKSSVPSVLDTGRRSIKMADFLQAHNTK